MIAIARAAYIKYVPRIGREPPPMLADFAAEIAAGHAVVLEITGTVEGYLISWPKTEAYFIDNIAVDPAPRVWDWDDSSWNMPSAKRSVTIYPPSNSAPM
jgi:hypothetical protein